MTFDEALAALHDVADPEKGVEMQAYQGAAAAQRCLRLGDGSVLGARV